MEYDERYNGIDLEDGRITEHFFWAEAKCNHCGALPPNPQTIINTANFLERVREKLGGVPLDVNSWYRCPFWNHAVGGATDSMHMKGYAVDITVKTMTPGNVQKILRQYFGEAGFIKGFGIYKGFTHVDRRTGTPSKWNG